jgi:hypothetical protein
LPNVGKVRATKLYDLGYKDVDSVAELDDAKLKKILNLKEDLVKEIKSVALRLSAL